MDLNTPQPTCKLRAVSHRLLYIVRTGCQWRHMPTDLMPWEVVYQQTQCWMRIRVFEAIGHDLRELISISLAGTSPESSAAMMDERTM